MRAAPRGSTVVAHVDVFSGLRVNGARIGTRFLRCALLAAAAIVAAPSPAEGQTPPPVAGQTTPASAKRPLGKLEQESVDDAMKSLGQPLIDPAPQGKTIGKVLVVNEDVFSQRDWYFQIFNIFHRTTRSYILERELLFRAGDVYDQALVEESTRNLQAPPPLVINRRPLFQPELSSVVVILPLASPVPGQVDVLLVTRDVWSLRFNSNFEYQGNELTLLRASLSENNLFGWRKYLAATFSFDQGAYYYGPQYFDPNIAGTRLQLWASATLYNSRATHDYEGNSEIVSLRYPFYSLATRWAGGVDVVHSNTILRDFLGNSLRPVDLTATPAMEAIPLEYRRRLTVIDGNVSRSVGSAALIQRVGAGYLVDSRHSEVPPDFADPALAPEFLAEYAPISETKSEPYLRYTMFTPRYAVLRDLDTFELRENRRFGPLLDVQAGEGLPALGADRLALDLRGEAKYAIGPAGSYAFLDLYGEARLWDGQWIDQRGTVTAYLATPVYGRLLRVVTQAQLDSYRADTRRSAIVVGGATGLRGYAIGEFRGNTAFLGHVEVRTLAVPIWSQRFGALLFYDVGEAAPALDQLHLRNDVGAGLRWLVVQANSAVLRFDWAVPLQDGTVTRAGFPGRLSAGFEQVF